MEVVRLRRGPVDFKTMQLAASHVVPASALHVLHDVASALVGVWCVPVDSPSGMSLF